MDLIKVLLKRGHISDEEAQFVQKEMKETGRKPEQVILENDMVTEDKLFEIKKELLDLPLIKKYPEDVSNDVLRLINRNSAVHYNFVPISRETGGTIKVGMVYPQDIQAREALKFLSRRGQFSYKIVLITPSVLNKLLNQYQTAEKEVEEALQGLETEIQKDKTEIDLEKVKGKADKEIAQAPVIRMVAVILREAVDAGASDIHIEPMTDQIKVRLRIDGVLHTKLRLPLKVHSAIVTRIKILSNLKIDESRIPQDGRFSTRFGGRRLDFRVSTFPTTLGEKVAIRVLDPRKGQKELEELGLLNHQVQMLREAAAMPFGSILATGPTGSGKSTTLYSILKIINQEDVNVVTLEDPVEYTIEGVNQSQIRPEIGYTFNRGLRQIVRQDPDAIMVGEIRDEETADLVIHAALTGHIVLSTLHTNDAKGVIPRLIDMGIQPFLLSPTLRYTIAQRLVRNLVPESRQRVKAKPKEEKIIMDEIKKLPPKIRSKIEIPSPLYIYKPGSTKEAPSGYKGQAGIFEVFRMTESLEKLGTGRLEEGDIEREIRRQNMVTMRQSGMIKVIQGKTSLEEVIRVTAQ